MVITLYKNFSKRRNSTKRPNTGTDATVYLKEGTSLERPTFIIDAVDLDVNYCKWNDHYYFIDDITVSTEHVYELSCTQDVLATYKNAIGSLNTFIERSASAYDAWINDPLLTAKQEIEYENVVRTSLALFSSQTGSFIVEILNENGVQLYATKDLTPFGIVFNPASYQPSDILAWIDSKISQAFDLDVYIGTVRWVPFDPTQMGGTNTHTVKIGPLSMATTYDDLYEIPQKHYFSSSYSVNLPALYYNDFRAANPRFTEYRMYVPGIGIINLDSALIASLVKNGKSMNVNVDADLVSGDVAYSFNCGQYYTPVTQVKGNLSVNVPIGKSVADVMNTFSTLVGGGVGAVTSAMAGNTVGAVAAAAGTAISVIDNVISPNTSIMGGSGNKALLLSDTGIKISEFCYATKQFPTSVGGRPLYEYRTISTLSGYVKCGGAAIDIPGLEPDKTEVNNYLNSGFYYE